MSKRMHISTKAWKNEHSNERTVGQTNKRMNETIIDDDASAAAAAADDDDDAAGDDN